MMPQRPKSSSATGRGYPQGSDSYRRDDVARVDLEEAHYQARKALRTGDRPR